MVNSNKNDNSKLAKLVNALQSRITKLEAENSALQKRLIKVEELQGVTSNVNSILSKEVDSLSQYHRRSNVIIRGMHLPEVETEHDVKEKVETIILKEMKLPAHVSNDIDKAHRVGKIINKDGKKLQNIIVRFKSHSARYAVYKKRKAVKNKKISPNLTPHRSKLLLEAIDMCESIEKNDWGFAFANQHGDLQIRLSEPFEGKHFFSFDSRETLAELLEKVGLLIANE